jgi:site-specific DNA-adenine methylase
MTSSHFVIPYTGNKYKEYQKHYKSYLNFDGIKTVIEPFSGSCAMSFLIWKERKDLTFIINDISDMTYKIYELYRSMSPEEFKEKIDERCEFLKDEATWKLERPKMTENIFSYIVMNKFHNFRPGLYPTKCKTTWKYEWVKLQLEFYEFINSPNVIISNKDWIEVFDEHKDDSTVLFLFDPPYLESFNGYYEFKKQGTVNVYEFFGNHDELKFNSKIYFVLESNWIIKLLFKNHSFVYEYSKVYELSKKKTTHCLIKW